jgi:hypothetical protein
MVDRVVYAVQTCTNCLPDLNMLISPQFMQFFEEQVWPNVCRRRAHWHIPCQGHAGCVTRARKFGIIAHMCSHRPKAMVQSYRGRCLGQVINMSQVSGRSCSAASPFDRAQSVWRPCCRLVVLGRRLHICRTNRSICAVLARHHGAFELLDPGYVAAVAERCILSEAQMDVTC